MTEVDVVLPEGVAEPTTKLLAKAAAAKTAAKGDDNKKSSEDQQNEQNTNSKTELEKEQSEQDDEQQHTKPDKEVDTVITTKLPLDSNSNSNSNNDCKIETPAKSATESMDLDDAEEVDGDSQITSASSTENGNSKEPKVAGEIEGECGTAEADEEEEVTTNGDHEEAEDEPDKIGSTAENSCDAEDPLGAATQSEVDQDVEDVTQDEKKSIEDVDDAEVEEEDGSQLSGTAKTGTDSDAEAIHTEDDEAEEKKETPMNGFVESPKPAEAATTESKPNGQANTSESTRSSNDNDAAGVVNLDEDSDEEMPETTKQNTPLTVAKAQVPPSKASITIPAAASSGAESSDDAVLIASDSDSESGQPAKAPIPTPIKKVSPVVKAVQPPPPPPQDDDDDDDDCVVIEDDTPPSVSPNDHMNKRKSDLDDMQPNSKRQRSSTPSTLGMGMGAGVGLGLGQLTIKDARSLMPHETGSLPGGAVYPVTITNAVTGIATNLGNTPPKLVPMSGVTATVGNTVQLNPPTLSLTAAGLPNITNNANLLPGLTDDMFVLEAPSFIVPYIYEKPPNDNIREVIKAIETKYSLSAEDLAVADKVDEFDMMTEQNKEDKPNADDQKTQGKKKKKRGDDESWSEQSDEDDDDDDDDDSESGVRTKVLIKEANDDLTALKGAITFLWCI